MDEFINHGAVFVAAEAVDNKTMVLREEAFAVEILSSERISEADAKDIAFDVIGASKWEKRIFAMGLGQQALLPSRPGFRLFVRRTANGAALLILGGDYLDAIRHDLDWSNED